MVTGGEPTFTESDSTAPTFDKDSTILDAISAAAYTTQQNIEARSYRGSHWGF